MKKAPELEWMNVAACPDGRDIFFEPELEDLAKDLYCSRCPVTWDCFRYGVRVGNEWGVFGGMNPKERLSLLRSFRYRLPKTQPATHVHHLAALRSKQKELQPC